MVYRGVDGHVENVLSPQMSTTSCSSPVSVFVLYFFSLQLKVFSGGGSLLGDPTTSHRGSVSFIPFSRCVVLHVCLKTDGDSHLCIII